ncbi:dialkylresorcinol condensing enzyme [Ectothiorhodospiraceae bacterium WFHF3C12]|nr:dialkylresorcinol condensing enzyme [Ectothiorhodospiraceae bacterium WFHF3C12]
MKRVLVVYFSQTGQLASIARTLSEPLASAADCEVEYEALTPRKPYPFPWPVFDFLDAFPETVALEPPEIEPLRADPDQRYDLIILAYTVWFLSPAPPITAFLKSGSGRALLSNTPVVTVVGCRNMWLQAQEDMKALLAEAGARHVDHVALTDRGSSLKTLITTPRWMLTGRRDPFWGVFPRAGIDAADIRDSARFGNALLRALRAGTIDSGEPTLRGLGAAPVDDRLIDSERIGKRSFTIWSKLLRRVGPPGTAARRAVLGIYLVFLVTMIATVVPITMTLRALLRPLRQRKISAQKAYFEQPSGSDRSGIHS